MPFVKEQTETLLKAIFVGIEVSKTLSTQAFFKCLVIEKLQGKPKLNLTPLHTKI